ncbi:MAG TPA: SEL1-like repeat protein [Victivallales bacterium]|nr:SEL1-like repeat protein [Victivallales bacterium]
MLTGKLPKGRFDMPSELGFSKKWDRIINGCLRNNPDDRFESAEKVLKVLNKRKNRKFIIVFMCCALAGLLIILAFIFNRKTDNNTIAPVKLKESESSSPITIKKEGNSKIPVLHDVKEASMVKSVTAERENAVSLFKTGKKYYLNKQYGLALEPLKQAANLGNSYAQNMLGIMHYKGFGIKKNYSSAFKLFTSASEKNNAEAQENLGRMYCYGQGTHKDLRKAFKLYSMAVNNGARAEAQYSLAQFYYYGKGTEVNKKEAFKYFKESAENGYSKAQANLGWLYYLGDGTSIDYSKSIKWLKKAAEAGVAAAQNNLGWMYKNGYGVHKPDLYKAIKWFKKAADQGDAKAQVNLAAFYYKKKEFTMAFQLLKKAAEKGNADGQYNLGWMYSNGVGIEKNLSKGKYWYKKAADQGNEKAGKNLQILKK